MTKETVDERVNEDAPSAVVLVPLGCPQFHPSARERTRDDSCHVTLRHDPVTHQYRRGDKARKDNPKIN